MVEEINNFNERLTRKIRRLTRIGIALSSERNIERLFEVIVEEARELTGADGGTLYIMSDDEAELQFAIVQTQTLHLRMGGTGSRITWKPVWLKKTDGSSNHENVCAHVALTGNTINIEDVYDAAGFDFLGTKKFDAATGYRSKSMLVVPMKNHEDDIIGVLQLINSRDETTGEVVSFSKEYLEMTESLASQAAVALSNNRLIHELEALIEAFIRAIAMAIDEKSPYTGGHVRRVAELTMDIAHRINHIKVGPFAKIHFSADQLKELQIAAWLHDVGKITIPEYVVDKATKLEKIFDGIELIRLRFEIYRLQRILERHGKNKKSQPPLDKEDAALGRILRDEYAYLSKANIGNRWMSDDMLDKIKKIAARTLILNEQQESLLSQEDVENLSIRQGTLSTKERELIKNHARMTDRILSQLPFPKKMRHAAEYAAAHHETLNGKGYPKGLDASRLPIQSRILALADVFEALTAKDRPYQRQKTQREAMDILESMVKEGHIDPDLYNLFKSENIASHYFQRNKKTQHMGKIKENGR